MACVSISEDRPYVWSKGPLKRDIPMSRVFGECHIKAQIFACDKEIDGVHSHEKLGRQSASTEPKGGSGTLVPSNRSSERADVMCFLMKDSNVSATSGFPVFYRVFPVCTPSTVL